MLFLSIRLFGVGDHLVRRWLGHRNRMARLEVGYHLETVGHISPGWSSR